MSATRTWLDALTDGHIIRDWFSLIAQFALGMTYFTFFTTGFSMSIGLSFVLIGIPLLLFMLASVRTVAAMDQRLFAGILDLPIPDITDDVDTTGANLGQRLGMYLGSATTWRSMVYLAIKLPIGIGAIMAAMFILPFLAFEVLLLGPLTIDLHLATVRLLHAIAIGAHKLPGMILPTGKQKRNFSRLESAEGEEPEYYLDDDGEIAMRKRA